MNVYADEAFVAATTAEFVRRGFPILQSHKLAESDREHVRCLLEYFSPSAGACILDAGCGVGAVASLMSEMRPDLRFTLLNISPSQLGFAPDFPKIEADFHSIPREDESFDAVMFNYALGHGSLDDCMGEARRVLKPGGVLFLYELTTDDPAAQAFVFEHAGYKPHSLDELKNAGAAFSDSTFVEPRTSTRDFINLLGAAAFSEHGFDRVRPVVCRFVK